MEYPKHLHKPGRLWKEVTDPASEAAAIADGWSLKAIESDWCEPPAVAPIAEPIPKPKKAKAA